jgi:hypothetical protein
MKRATGRAAMINSPSVDVSREGVPEHDVAAIEIIRARSIAREAPE